MWRELIQSLNPAATFLPAATALQITEVEAFLGVLLPDNLKQLLEESNGILGEYGVSFILSTEGIILRNREMHEPAARANYLPLDHYLFFADAGNGDLFAFGIIEGQVKFERIFAWNHEDDSRICVASSLEDFLTRWLSGKLSI